MSDITIVVTKPTAMRGGFDQAKLNHQLEELGRYTQHFIGRNVDGQTVSFIQRIFEAVIADYGWLDGGIKVTPTEPEPIQITLSFRFQRREVVNQKWTCWYPLNLNNEGEGLQVGQKYQKRISDDEGLTWKEGPVLIWEGTEDEGAS